jgi:hypothetical protein
VVAREEEIKGGAEKRWKRRRVYRWTGPALERRPIENDPAFKTYISKLNKPEKPLARANYLDCVGAAYAMLKSMGIPITDYSIADLVRRKEENPRDMSIEKALTVLKSTPTVRTNTVHASRMVGLFKANFVPLSIHIWVKSGRPTKPIQETVLRAIRQDSELKQIHHDLLDLMAYSGERIQALAMTPPEDVSFVEGTEAAIISVSPARSKTATEHPTAITRELAERLLQRAQEYGYPVILPNYNSLFRTITKLSEQKYGIHLTSHYLRKRFETICETIPANEMNPNHWLILMGAKPSYGHRPDIYSLRSDEQLAKEWETHLLPRLDLSRRPFQQQNNDLTKENQELKEQILKLTKLLTEKLTTS